MCSSDLYGLPTPTGADVSAPVVGLFYGGGIDLLWTQFYGVASVAITVFVVSIVLMYAVKATGTLRVSPAGETEGLDLHEHGTGAYPEFVVTRGMGIMSSMASSPVPAARPATESGK